jgi:RNA polymerase sigma factor (sigma-70 family)
MDIDDREQVARRALTVALRTAAGIVGNRDQAADIAQEVALDALKSLPRLRDPDAFDGWVRKIAVRHTLRALRKHRSGPGEVPLGLAVDFGDLPDHEIDRDLMIAARGALVQALMTLPPRQRVALVLRYVHDLNDREIAAALGCRRGTANALLSRGRATLRQSPALKDLVSAMEVSR